MVVFDATTLLLLLAPDASVCSARSPRPRSRAKSRSRSRRGRLKELVIEELVRQLEQEYENLKTLGFSPE